MELYYTLRTKGGYIQYARVYYSLQAFVGRSDMTFAVDWAFKANYLSICRPLHLHKKQNCMGNVGDCGLSVGSSRQKSTWGSLG